MRRMNKNRDLKRFELILVYHVAKSSKNVYFQCGNYRFIYTLNQCFSASFSFGLKIIISNISNIQFLFREVSSFFSPNINSVMKENR